MGMILDTNHAHIAHLRSLVKKEPKAVLIGTFSIYAGILHDGEDSHSWGGKYENEIHNILDDLVETPNVRILVGFPPLNLCVPNCEECLYKHQKWAMRLLKHVEKWPQFQWRIIEEFHLKCYLFFYNDIPPEGIGGGRNLTTSNWTDASIVLNKKQVLKMGELFAKSWSKAGEVNEEALDAITMRQIDGANKNAERQ
jgi:hypothetical protein